MTSTEKVQITDTTALEAELFAAIEDLLYLGVAEDLERDSNPFYEIEIMGHAASKCSALWNKSAGC
jgi:hypothetical protein